MRTRAQSCTCLCVRHQMRRAQKQSKRALVLHASLEVTPRSAIRVAAALSPRRYAAKHNFKEKLQGRIKWSKDDKDMAKVIRL